MSDTIWHFTTDTLTSVAAHFATVAIVTLVGLLGGVYTFWNSLRFMWRMRKNGFLNFYNNRSEYRTARKQQNFDDYILLAKSRLTYVGYYLSFGTDESRLDGAIAKLLERNCAVELVLLDHELDEASLRVVEAHLGIATKTLANRLANAHAHFKKLRENMSIDSQKRFTIKRHKAIVASSAFFIDWGDKNGRLLVDTKIPGAGREKSFGMEFTGKPMEGTLAMEWAQAFQRITDAATS